MVANPSSGSGGLKGQVSKRTIFSAWRRRVYRRRWKKFKEVLEKIKQFFCSDESIDCIITPKEMQTKDKEVANDEEPFSYSYPLTSARFCESYSDQCWKEESGQPGTLSDRQNEAIQSDAHVTAIHAKSVSFNLNSDVDSDELASLVSSSNEEEHDSRSELSSDDDDLPIGSLSELFPTS